MVKFHYINFFGDIVVTVMFPGGWLVVGDTGRLDCRTGILAEDEAYV